MEKNNSNYHNNNNNSRELKQSLVGYLLQHIRAQSNGRVEQVNGILKAILKRSLLDVSGMKLIDSPSCAVSVFN